MSSLRWGLSVALAGDLAEPAAVARAARLDAGLELPPGTTAATSA